MVYYWFDQFSGRLWLASGLLNSKYSLEDVDTQDQFLTSVTAGT